MKLALAILASATLGISAPAESEFEYHAVDERKTSAIHYKLHYGMRIGFGPGNRKNLSFGRSHEVLGCALDRFTYTNKFGEAAIARPNQYHAFIREVRAFPLKRLNPKRVLSWEYRVNLDGRYYPLSGSLHDPDRAKLHAFILGFAERVIPKAKRHTSVRTIEGDLVPARRIEFAELFVRPERFDGKRVIVTGYLPGPGANARLYASKTWWRERPGQYVDIGSPSTFAPGSKHVTYFSRNTVVSITGTLRVRSGGNLPPELDLERTTELKRVQTQK